MKRNWSGQTVVIVGAARQGLALARYLLDHAARVRLTDQRPPEALAEARQSLADLEASGRLEWICGGHPRSLLDGADWLCPSGGVPLTLPLVQEAVGRGIPLTNDSQIFLEAAPCRVVGITGSAGKTTTTTLVGRMAAAAVELLTAGIRQSYVGGNIGAPLIAQVDAMQPDDLAIMELSSFQLEIMNRSPQVAAVLNVTPNHLDRHGTMEAYAAAKANILTHQAAEDTAVLGRDDPGAWALAGQTAGRVWSFGFSPLPAGQLGAYLDGAPEDSAARLMLRRQPGMDTPVMLRQEILLRGNHNVMNALGALAVAAAAGLSDEALRAGVVGFTGVAHRLQYVRTWGGADWYNGSIASAPERVMADIRAFHEPLVLLVGGRDKKLPWGELVALIQRRVDHLIAFGEAAEIVLQALEAAPLPNRRLQGVIRCAGLRQAVQAAAQVAEPGQVVLLSPGGTSFDEFKDFEERGRCFAQWVNELP